MRLDKFKLDDVGGAVAVHGCGGVWGALAVALSPKGDFTFSAVLIQLAGIVAAFLWSFPLAFGFFKLLEKTVGIRALTLHEQRGLVFTEHYNVGYPEFQKRLDANDA